MTPSPGNPWEPESENRQNGFKHIQFEKYNFSFTFCHCTVEFHVFFSPMNHCTTRASSGIQGFVHKGMFGTRTK